MKKKILIIVSSLLLIAGIVYSIPFFTQNPPTPVNNWYKYKALTADSGLNLPNNFTSVINGNWYVKKGGLVYNPADSTVYRWTGTQLLPTQKIANGLTDSLGRVLLGGTLYKTAVLNTNAKTFFVKDLAANFNTNPIFAVGNSTVSNNGFDPPMVISDSPQYVGFNSPFLSMYTVGLPGTPGSLPNGFLWLNFQAFQDSVQANERVFTPTVSQSTYGLDINGNPNACDLCSMFDVFFYGDRTGNQGFGPTGAKIAEFHYGPFNGSQGLGYTIWQVDSNFNMILGPARDSAAGPFGAKYAVAKAHLDVYSNASTTVTHSTLNKSMWLHDSLATAQIDGPLLHGNFTTTGKNAIANKKEGMIVYDITLHQMSYWNGTTWVNF